MKETALVKEVFDADSTFLFADKVSIKEDLRIRILRELNGFINSFFNDLKIIRIELEIKDLLDFLTFYNDNPARDGAGATRYNNLLWLFIFCRCLRPEIIVESGVYIGRSLWTLRKASPGAELYAFDIDLKRLKFHDDSITYREMDWSQYEVQAKSRNDLCYFDDHINNCLRIKQAYERGFKHIIFDDSPSVMNLHSFRFPGVPTAQMILDNNLKEGDVITWKWQDKILRYTHSESYTFAVRDMIERIVVLPNLVKYTGQEGSEHFVYVHLK